MADANEQLQTPVQSGTQGNRDVELYSVAEKLLSDFQGAVDKSKWSQIRLRRNEMLISNIYKLLGAIFTFNPVYLIIEFTSHTLSSLGVFHFAIFHLAPRVSTLNNMIYSIEGNLPHLVRTQQFVVEIKAQRERDDRSKEVSDRIDSLSFEESHFRTALNRFWMASILNLSAGKFPRPLVHRERVNQRLSPWWQGSIGPTVVRSLQIRFQFLNLTCKDGEKASLSLGNIHSCSTIRSATTSRSLRKT